VPVGSEVYIFVVKAHRGNPWKEIEFFTQTELLASQQGTVFFDLYPSRVEILDQTFRLTTGIHVVSNTVRFFWNPGSGSTDIRYIDYDVDVNEAVSAPAQLPFSGVDPFVLDGRVTGHPNRFYMLYVDGGAQKIRHSDDAGATWTGEVIIDAATAQVLAAEGSFEDPDTDRNLISVLQRRV
jgi:hypothetical protein